MKTKELKGALVFKSLIFDWEKNRLCPFALIDYLLEEGFELQAQAAREAIEQELYPICDNENFYWDYRDTAKFPYESYKNGCVRDYILLVNIDNHEKSESGWSFMYDSFIDAIIGYLDGYANWITNECE